MRVLLAGSTGAVGQPLVRALTAAGHQVLAVIRDPAKGPLVTGLGADPVVADVLRRAMTRPLVIAGAVLGALTFGGIGLWAFFWPRSFYEQIAMFPPYNVHLIHDLGAFQLGLAADPWVLSVLALVLVAAAVARYLRVRS